MPSIAGVDMKVQAENAARLGRQVLGLLPPPTHRVSLTRGPEFARGVRDLLSKYAASTRPTVGSLHEALRQAPFRQPTYGDFLVYSQTFSPQEPLGTFLFSFKQEDNGSSMDMLLTPTSLFMLSGMEAAKAPQTHKVAGVWYGSGSGLADFIPNLSELMDTGEFHTLLTPVGPMVQSVHSTFVTKVTSAMKGVGLARDEPRAHVGLTLPCDMLVDLDESCPMVQRREPAGLNVTIYASLVYLRVNQRPSMALTFFQSGKGFAEVVAMIKDHFTDVIRTKYIQLRHELYINRLVFGAVCTLGTVPFDSHPVHQSLNVKGTSLPVLVFANFEAACGPWTVFL